MRFSTIQPFLVEMEVDLKAFEASFSKEGPLRQHQIICGARIFHVNGHSLAEQSPYFEKLFFGTTGKTAKKTLVLSPGFQPDSILKYLFVVYGRKEVGADNCAAVMYLSDQWDTPLLMAKCEKFLKSDFWKQPETAREAHIVKRSVSILEMALQVSMKKHIVYLAEFIGKNVSLEELQQERFFERIRDSRTVGAILYLVGESLFASIDAKQKWEPTSFYEKCSYPECTRQANFTCSQQTGNKFLCQRHMTQIAGSRREDLYLDESILFSQDGLSQPKT